ncbi:MAG: serine/threonine-protein kinase [Myxococcota bacterium]|nr:serine/threonine-protein kinase [Myxococcota bacterium]
MEGSTRDLSEATPESVVDRRYLIRREIARGGMGCVFEAEHVVTRAKVAIKTLTRPALDHPAAHARLMREARVLGVLRHPNVVLVQDAGSCPAHGPFIALEMIDGRPLDGILIARRTLPVAQAVAVVVQLCQALSAVHQFGIVHRDVKPSNVLIARSPLGDRVELIDFGVAQVGAADDVTGEKLTKMGELLGTVEYMSPEQIMGRPIDGRTDIYGVGVLLYECLTGEVPFAGSPTAVIANLVAGTRPAGIRERRGDVPLELEAVVRKALEIDPERRYGTAQELGDACVAALAGQTAALDLLEVRTDQRAPAAAREAAPTVADNILRRRHFVRAPYVTPVRVLREGRTLDGRTEDISEGGVLVVADGETVANEMVKVRLPLPTTGRVVTIDAVVRWIKTNRNQRALGLEFEGVSEDVKNEIRAYAALMTGGKVAPANLR